MGCDFRLLLIVLEIRRFNPRTRMGCDVQTAAFTRFKEVSIHAPAWGATLISLSNNVCKMFQSTHPHGVRQHKRLYHSVLEQFQSTHPHGVRLHGALRSHCVKRFQSTHPHGVRLKDGNITCVTLLFQSTHPHGVRHDVQADVAQGRWFQSTHPHGVRLLNSALSNYSFCFNPRTRMGCDRILSNELNIIVQIYRICE